jgi:hypothetical protein
MSLHKQQDSDSMDGYLRRRLQSWVARAHPPKDGRARLLWEAARQSHQSNQGNYFLFLGSSIFTPSEIEQAYFVHGSVVQAVVSTFQLKFVNVL